ncbi:MAG: hypothetical protein PHS46_06940 [Candidatus Omnitrophica bacterium]|nr:hypothetical protein [Candidatus Omnitrophota bacterium]
MRIILVIAGTSGKNILVKLYSQDDIRNVRELLWQRKHPEAMAIALKKGRFEKEVEDHELGDLGAELILRKDRAYWDITGRK